MKTAAPLFVICSKCGGEMTEYEDGWYCMADACTPCHYITRKGAQTQWKRRCDKERRKWADWIDLVETGTGLRRR